MIGQTFDHYLIESKLGEGGMGVVYKARDTRLDRTVAIKVLPDAKIADPSRKQRFAQEAKAASALNHPNIVTIHDIRSQDGTDFIVMECVDGQTLSELIPSKGMRPPQALKYAVQMADALAKAHAAGIVHRDLKPSNVMITEEGRVKILDFGMAKLMEAVESSPDAPTVTARQLTEEGAVVGTAAYMSPEQAEGRKLDGRSDIFSFGSVLYEMVTGQRPFGGDSRLSVLSKILNEDPKPPSQQTPAIPPELDKIVLRCLRKDPARRYQTMADLKVALEDVDEESVGYRATTAGERSSPQVAQVPAPSWRRWLWAALLPVLLVAGYFAWRRWPAPERVEPMQAVPLTTQPGVHRYPSFSPDGNHIVFTWNGPKQDNQDIYVQQIGAGRPLRRTTDPRNDYNPVWSPDGRYIAFLRSLPETGTSELRLIAPLDGPEQRVAEIRVHHATFVTSPYMTWCPDSTCVVVTDSPDEVRPAALFVVSLDTGEKRRLTNPQPPASGDANPAISPDGSWLVFRRSPSGLFGGELYRLELGRGLTAIGEPERIAEAALDANYPTWMPSGKEILFSDRGSLWILDVAGEGPPARLPFVGEDGIMPVVSQPQAGRPPHLVYVRSFMDGNIWRIETSAPGLAASTPPVVSVASTRLDAMPQLSPDGRRVAFASDRAGVGGIWLADLDGSNAVPLASMNAMATGYPHWSPDGQLIAFHSNRGGQADVYLVAAAGGKPRNVTSHPAVDSFPSFSRDGKWIYFTSNRTGERRVWKMPSSGGDAVPVTDRVGFMPAESPDGAWLYYMESVFTPGPLWRVRVNGGVPEKVLDGVVLGNYVVLEKGIYYIDRPSGEASIYWIDRPSGETRLQYFDFATRRSRTVARNLGKVDTPLTASPDGRTILFCRMDSSVDDLMLVENFR
jgi:eukaryotic-like serine/threonine-protein kinase